MDRASIIAWIGTVALVLALISLSPIPAYHSNRRLKLPSTFERRRDNNEDSFNVTGRLAELFPKVDVDPTDGFLTQHELTLWSLRHTRRSCRSMHHYDTNHDGYVSFSEYYPPSWIQSAGDDYFGLRWREEHFDASDADGDGLLNSTEFNDFLHPADSKNPKLLQWLCKEEVRERDTDRDGKVNFKEFFHGLFDLVRNYDDESKNDSQHYQDSRDAYAPARKLFSQLDRDGDGYLSHLELLPIIAKIHPSEHYYAKQQANYIISQDDANKDGRLTLTEIIENPYLFYSAIFNDEEDEYDSHDESY